MRFRDRRAAGAALAPLVRDAVAGDDALILALPRGGVPVAHVIARALGAPLDVWVARKLGAPQQPELGVGAIAEGGGSYVDERLAAYVGVDAAALERVAARERVELDRRAALYRGGRSRPAVSGRAVVLVDDGVATGGTVRASIAAVRAAGARRVVVAVPVGAHDALRALDADLVVAVVDAHDLHAVGAWYDDFAQTSDDEVLALLADARRAAEESARTRPHTTSART